MSFGNIVVHGFNSRVTSNSGWRIQPVENEELTYLDDICSLFDAWCATMGLLNMSMDPVDNPMSPQ